MKIIQNTLKIQKNISNVSKKNWVGPKKVGSVGFLKRDNFFFFWRKSLSDKSNTLCFVTSEDSDQPGELFR